MKVEIKQIEQEYIKKLNENPLDRETRVKLTKIYVEHKMFDLAESLWLDYADYLDRIPKNQVDVNAEVDFAIWINKEIIEQKRAYKMKQTNIIEMKKLASNFEVKGEFEQAQKIYEELLGHSLDKERQAILKRLGKICFGLGNYEDSKKYFEEYCILEKGNLEVEIVLIKIYEILGQTENAENLLINNIKTNPNNLILKLQLGKIYLSKMEIGKAQEEFSQIIEENPSFLQAQLAMAKVYAIKAGDKRKEMIYDILLDNSGDYPIDEKQDQKTRSKIINKHIIKFKNTRKYYGLFNEENYIEKITDCMNLIMQKKVKALEGFEEADIYCIPIKNAGQSSGKDGYKERLNNITLIYSKGKGKMLVAFPTKDLNQITLEKENQDSVIESR